ncbi:MAG: PQQ-dependent sugar dehydrogenase [Sphingomonadaceae bacterium]
MSKHRKTIIIILVVLAVLIAGGWYLLRGQTAELPFGDVTGTRPELGEPSPETIPTVNIAKPVGWQDNETPRSAEGLVTNRFADGLDHPRVIYTLPNGDVLVALANRPDDSSPGGIEGFFMNWFFDRAGAGGASPDQIILLRDSNGDGKADLRKVLREGLASPSGIAWGNGKLYVANHNALLSFDYTPGDEALAGEPEKLMDLPPGGNHWMRNIILSPDGKSLYVAVGSASNIGERGMELEEGRAMIWEYDLEARQQRMFAAGLRNPNGLAFSPFTDELWTTVNERDMLGSDLVPDYLTNVPIGAQYGWPWAYWKDHMDRRVTAPLPAYLLEYTRKPEMALGPHVAALGLVFTQGGSRMGPEFSQGAFIAQHGSWNRKPASGYDVVYVAFDDHGNPIGKPQTVLDGFLRDDGKTRGRPTWLAWAQDGALLLSDDTAGIIWRVQNPQTQPATAIEKIKGASLPPRKELDGNTAASFGADDYARVEPASE